ncbi:MAG TPA: 3'-5' exonuclease [Gemmatimonadales bacterium]|nr:3'-5' exonuclease [Gemmatimonadales bacterium]
MHDASPPARRPLNGIAPVSANSLSGRAVAYLEAGPADAVVLARDVLGVVRPRREIADRLLSTLLGSDPRVSRLSDGRWTLAGAAPSPLIEQCTFAVVDVETTGMSPAKGGRVIDVAIARLTPSGITLVIDTLVKGDAPVPEGIAGLTGITGEMLRRAPAFETVADQLLEAIRDAVFVAHNARYDWGFLNAELDRARAVRLTGPRLCTIRLTRKLVPALDYRNLDAVMYHFGITTPARHRAGPDAVATAKVLERLLPLARDRGARTLADLGAL